MFHVTPGHEVDCYHICLSILQKKNLCLDNSLTLAHLVNLIKVGSPWDQF